MGYHEGTGSVSARSRRYTGDSLWTARVVVPTLVCLRRRSTIGGSHRVFFGGSLLDLKELHTPPEKLTSAKIKSLPD